MPRSLGLKDAAVTARLLICAEDKGGSGAGRWLKGQVVEARLDGEPAYDGFELDPSRFLIVTLTDVSTRSAVNKYVEENVDRDGVLLGRRKVRMKVAEVDDTRINRAGRLSTVLTDFDSRTEAL